MPTIKPFSAVRYAPDVPLDMVTCPPYDVISDPQLEALRAKDPRNFVNALLPEPRASLDPKTYERCADFLVRWLAEGTLIEDASPAAYLYGAEYELGSDLHSSRALIASLDLERFGEGGICPHENTTAGPKKDRALSMRATRFNLEPLWFFASKPIAGFQELIEIAETTTPAGDVTDNDGVRHRLWKVGASQAERAMSSIDSTPLVVADGHHRYETALEYRDAMRESSGPGPWDQTLALISDPSTHPPSVFGIHRIVEANLAEILRRLESSSFDEMEAMPTDDLMRQVQGNGHGTIGVASADASLLVRTRGDLDTTFLAQTILTPLGLTPRYEHDLVEVQGAVVSGRVAFLMNAPPLELVARMALNGQRMPPKTTLFWPKPLSGMVMRRLVHP